MVLSIEEYRTILNDRSSSDEQIKKRIEYIEAFCKNIIEIELDNYAKRYKTIEPTGGELLYG